MISVICPTENPSWTSRTYGADMTHHPKTYARHDPLPPTYQRLREAGAKQFALTKEEAGVKNLLSALSVFMKRFNFRDQDIIGSEFDVEFDHYLMQFREQLDFEGKAERTIKDRCEHLVRWKDMVVTIAQTSELPASFHDALTEAMYRRRMSIRVLSRVTGIAVSTLSTWASGETRPIQQVAAQLKKLETALRLPSDTLCSRLGFVIKRKQVTAAAKENKLQVTSYSNRLSLQRKREYRLNYLISIPDSMMVEWRQLLRYKISTVREHSSNNDVWRVKPRHKIGNKPTWCSITDDGQVVPTADACWSFLCRYFSWCALDMQHGGAGYPVERINTLAWLLNDKLVKSFLQWMQQRSGNILHSGITSFLLAAAMLLRPQTGWLWLNPSLAHKLDAKAQKACLGFDPEGMDPDELTEAWQQRCADVWASYHKDAKFLAGHKSLKKARDPREPILDILAHPRPLSIVMDMLATLKRNPPSSAQTKRYAVWTRDVLLLAWMTANPLRVGHLATMTYRTDNTGNLYKHEDETWHYRCGIDDFKNSPAQYMNTPDGMYDVRLPSYVGDAIEEYLKNGRPMLAGAFEGDFFFLPEKFANQTEYDGAGMRVPLLTDRWNGEAISTRLRLVTRSLRDGKPGFGSHACRHIVATDYLKRYPGAYKLVADLLCDKLDTVIKEYGHTSAQDGLDVHYAAADAEFRAAMNA
jgi:transcriptional regulator with XRE-family HTH domain